jgi:hypothetical protein
MKSLEVNLKDLLLYSYATNCHLDGYSVAKAELDLIPTFSTSELLENFKELILDLLNFKKFQKEGKGNDSVVQAMACKHQSEIQHYLKVQKELKNLLENSVLREEKLLKSHEYALSRIKDLELYNESLENSDKKNNWELIKKELSEKIIDLNQKIDQRDQILTKLESENSRLKSMLEEKFIEIEIIKKNMKKKLSKGKDGKSSISIEIAKKHLEEKALELVQNQQKIRERINGQVLREKNRENRKSYNSQDFSNLVVHPLDMKFSKHHKRSSSDYKN